MKPARLLVPDSKSEAAVKFRPTFPSQPRGHLRSRRIPQLAPRKLGTVTQSVRRALGVFRVQRVKISGCWSRHRQLLLSNAFVFTWYLASSKNTPSVHTPAGHTQGRYR